MPSPAFKGESKSRKEKIAMVDCVDLSWFRYNQVGDGLKQTVGLFKILDQRGGAQGQHGAFTVAKCYCCLFTDFDLQATLAEALFRIVEPNEKEDYAKQWFDEASVKSTFLQIRNSDFENVSILACPSSGPIPLGII